MGFFPVCALAVGDHLSCHRRGEWGEILPWPAAHHVSALYVIASEPCQRQELVIQLPASFANQWCRCVRLPNLPQALLILIPTHKPLPIDLFLIRRRGDDA